MGEARFEGLAGPWGGGGKADRGRTTPSLVHRVVVGAVLCAIAFVAAYGAGPSILPGLFDASAATERGLAELATCRLQVAALHSALKGSGRGRDGRRTFRPEREALQFPAEGGAAGGVLQDGVEQGDGAGMKFGRRPEDMDDETRVAEIKQLRALVQSLLQERLQLQAQVQGQGQGQGQGQAEGGISAAASLVTEEAVEGAKKLLEGCNTVKQVSAASGDLSSWKGYECNATKEDLERYMDYRPGQLCPNDWYFVQRLIFKKNCFALPRRRCLSVTPAKPSEPLPLPDALFNQEALRDENVRWDLHQCKSYECLNTRTSGDCRNCFNLRMEANRWKGFYRGAPPMAQVLNMKKGSIRLGLDVGGGTGSFAAHMATHGVTVRTTAFNVETVPGKKAGLPYMETIAQRGLVPLHWPHKARLPLYDGVLDIIHSVNSIKYIPPVEFEELIYEWDRVLRAGGLLWFEMFYAPVTEMPLYLAIIERMQYKRLYWNLTPKPDPGEREGEHVYLNCVLEKPPRPAKEPLAGPSQADMEDIV